MRRRWRPLVLAVAFGFLLVALGATIYQSFTSRADERVATGVAVAGRVIGVYSSRGPDEVTLEYEYGGFVYEATTRSLFGDAGDRYAKDAEVVLYLDPADPSSVALPGGFASDGGLLLVQLPAPLVANGLAVVVASVVGLFRHRIPFSTDYEGFDRPAMTPPLSAGHHLCATDVGVWLPAFDRLKTQLAAIGRHPDDGWHVYVEIIVAREGPNGLNPEFRGARVGPLSRKRGILRLSVVVPENATGSPDHLLREALVHAVDAAERFAERKGLTGQLAGAKRALQGLPPPEAYAPLRRQTGVPPANFTIGFRGYHFAEVDRIIGQAQDALRLETHALIGAALATIRSARLGKALRGYDREQVHSYLRLLEETLRLRQSQQVDPG